MSSAMPELIFVAGPQQGERAVLMTSTSLVGRSPAAEVRLMEEASSREHVRFQFTHEGWVMENLSANGTLINGKRFKRNKKVLLDTGDVMGIGLETKVLYIAPGDDPEAALQAWRSANPDTQATPKPPAPATRKEPPKKSVQAPVAPAATEKPSAQVTTKTDAGPKTAPPPGEAAGVEGEGEEGEGEAETGSMKLKIILLVGMMVGLVVCVAAFLLRPPPPTGFGGGREYGRLTATQITAALEEPIERPLGPAQAMAQLQSAVSSYTNKELWEPGDLYRCVHQFKLYRAYSQSPSFPKVQYERMYMAAARELDVRVRQMYETAWKYEKALSFRRAKESFEALMRELPHDQVEPESRINKVILRDIKEHIKFANSRLGNTR